MPGGVVARSVVAALCTVGLLAGLQALVGASHVLEYALGGLTGIVFCGVTGVTTGLVARRSPSAAVRAAMMLYPIKLLVLACAAAFITVADDFDRSAFGVAVGISALAYAITQAAAARRLVTQGRAAKRPNRPSS